MRARVLLAFAAVMVPQVASASVLTLGSFHATSCYRAAESRRADAEAFRACDTALATEALSQQERAGTFVNRGILFMALHRDDRASIDLAEAARIDPKQPETYVNQAMIAYRANAPVQARALATRALELGTRKPAYAHYIRGLANEDLGNLKAAYADHRTASALAPSWVDPRQELIRFRVR